MEQCRDVLEGAIEEAGRLVLSAILQASAESLTGPWHQGKAAGDRVRHGSQPGSVFLGRNKVRVERPRVRTKQGKEVKIPAYERLRSDETACRKVHDSVALGVSTRKYKKAVVDSLEAVGVSKSTVSRRFVKHSAKRLEEFLNRPVPSDLVAVLMDGIHLGDVLIVVAVGIDSKGAKHALSLVDGTTENAATVKSLLEDLIRRGMNVESRLLFVIDGGKALAAGIRDVCGTHHPVQRCRVHKLRNVEEKIPQAKHKYVRAAMRAAWKLPEKQGIQKMKELARELEVSHKDAANSLLEGLEQTFTINRLELSPMLTVSLASTNLIENAHGAIRSAVKRIKRFAKPEDAKRWAATILTDAQENFRTLKGHKDIWILQVALGHPVEEHRREA